MWESVRNFFQGCFFRERYDKFFLVKILWLELESAPGYEKLFSKKNFEAWAVK